MEIVSVKPQLAPVPSFELSTEEHADRLIRELGILILIDEQSTMKMREMIIENLKAAEIRGADSQWNVGW
jgi:hypothetical protein